MARKKKAEEGSSGAYWMDTYGDMITLVLTFFVLLFSMSTIDAAKWEQLVATLTGTPMAVVAPLNPGRSIAPDPSTAKPEPHEAAYTQQELEELSQRSFDELLEMVNELVEERELEDSLLIEVHENEIMLRFLDSLLFDSGKHVLREDSRAVVSDVLGILDETQEWIREINIEGHTDTVPIRASSMYRNNWDLSVMRAATVASFFESNSTIDPTKLKPSGCGETMPIDTNSTEEGRMHNRRVDVILRRIVIEVEIVPAAPFDDGTSDPASVRTVELWDD